MNGVHLPCQKSSIPNLALRGCTLEPADQSFCRAGNRSVGPAGRPGGRRSFSALRLRHRALRPATWGPAGGSGAAAERSDIAVVTSDNPRHEDPAGIVQATIGRWFFMSLGLVSAIGTALVFWVGAVMVILILFDGLVLEKRRSGAEDAEAS